MNLSGESAFQFCLFLLSNLRRISGLSVLITGFCFVIRLKSVICHFRGNREFPRLRIGELEFPDFMSLNGKPPGQMDPKALLLQKFHATAQGRIDAALQEGVDIMRSCFLKALPKVRDAYSDQKYKHLRLETLPT
ncbi:peptidyl-tRNA hydrolase [Pyrus ussuriensis x Pyrus communis]|uniref:Peptidyl-tRNA hydrolase n=1 Tax=Pyrus ussuriensis x Pyrus communis TaxID=2448454 RepID=A0A5N5FWN4_9ROSA|nr:peptidyl-tRNA hydrolase [Pyrus ussuriensis x Pyrus communis]